MNEFTVRSIRFVTVILVVIGVLVAVVNQVL
jgi:hypothetical protein